MDEWKSTGCQTSVLTNLIISNLGPLWYKSRWAFSYKYFYLSRTTIPNSSNLFSIFLTFLSENEEINFYVGAQPLKESRDLPDCVKEAYDHICLLDRIGAKRGICTFDNRLLVELLGTLHQNEYSIVLGNQALQKLLDHDRYNHTGYVHTIRIYLAHNCNATKTAEHLYIHRHTLMKRLQNISALCGINFTDYYMRVYMSLAILIHDYFTYWSIGATKYFRGWNEFFYQNFSKKTWHHLKTGVSFDTSKINKQTEPKRHKWFQRGNSEQ